MSEPHRELLKQVVTPDETKKKRENKQSQLRKQKKDQILEKKRREGPESVEQIDSQTLEKVCTCSNFFRAKTSFSSILL